ncbi:serine/threonine-protein kinase [Catelliglobosispora koreensis]|uniref:serine/threonine-protein kinase n=1 Tax=Catelliglobosispora koreensis TaxID=129052 RepID=UPI00036A2A5E|nr:serine/threonine-protein kinase [Catelliglobosispora koreensis]
MTEQRFGLIADRYLLRDQLGHGGMGRVWLARDEMLDREVAIKEVAPPTVLTEEESEQLHKLILREARAAGRINHPHVVKIFDVIQTEEWPWIVMEYIPSETLQRTVQFGGPLPPRRVAEIGLEMLEALVAAHEAGVLHRDVKPDNVLLADDGRVVLSDFGLASVDTDGSVTRTSQLGTPQYVAPERARYGTSSREADYWSLGATLYAAVEGRSPYARETVMETLTALAVDDPDPMRLAGPLEPAIQGLLRRNPKERLKPAELEDLLRAVAEGRPPRPAGDPPRERSKRLLVTAAFAVPIAVVAAFSLLHRTSSPVANTPSASPTPTSVPAAPGLPACDRRPPPHAVPPPAGVRPPPGDESKALLPGWVWFTDGATFHLGVPQRWLTWRAGETWCFADPNSSRLFAVTTASAPIEALPAYTLVNREEHLRAEPELQWEFSYDGPAHRRHAIALLTKGHTLFFATEESDFQPTRQSFYGGLLASFRGKKIPR